MEKQQLPALNPLIARSTWMQVVMVAIALSTALGIDLLAFTASVGLGSTAGEVVETGERAYVAYQTLAALALGILAWLERRAPNFRLSFRR